MTTIHNHRMATIVWISLIMLTLLGYWIGSLKDNHLLSLALLLGAAWIKGQLVISFFMEMHQATTRWRWVPTLWLTMVITTLALVYIY